MFEFASASGTGPEAASEAPSSSVEDTQDAGLDTADGDDDGEVVTEVEEPEEDDDLSEGEEESEDEGEEETPVDPKDKKATKKAALEKRIRELAKEDGLDPTDPTIYKLLRRTAVLEQRREDTEKFANDLKKELDWETPWEKEQRLKKQPPASDPQAKPAVAPAPQAATTPQPPAKQGSQVRPFVQVDQSGRALLGDGFDDKWTSARAAYDELSQAWSAITEAEEKGVPQEAMEHLHVKMDNVQRGIFRRHALELLPHFDRMIEERVEERLAKFRQESGLEEIAPAVQGALKQKSAAKIYESVHKDILANAELAPLLDEIMQKPADGSTIKLKGESVPASPLNLALAAEPELLEQLIELEQDPNTPEEVMRKAILRTYKMVMRQAHNRKAQTEKSKALVKQATRAGREQAERTAEKTVVRQEVQAANGTLAPTRRGKSLKNQVGPGLSMDAFAFA